jgi:uncharacterized protein with PIN domain
MSSNREALKVKLLAQAEAAIDKLLADERVHEKMTLSEIEAMVGQPEDEFRQGLLETVLDMQASDVAICLMCGGQLRNKGKRRRQIVTQRGEAVIERTYYQCQTCGRGYFPPRSTNGAE